MPAQAGAGNGTTRFGRTLEIERRNRRRSQPEATQRVALLLFRLWHDRGCIAQPFTRGTAVIAFVIVTGLIRGVIYVPLAIVFMRNGNGLVAQSLVENARVDDATGQPEQPD